ncbi:hypothetical protein TI39_contig4730g00001 [Zymoseptoria brevis]|uniref:Uncharacterized protein n=1 Tax=Zymoseptoria brevis TaxID=1047168 RepID=A0A0F4G6E2_9PEZI|nr:hypothetical protein TI39_contig4730g00001 [Zymoseptoria brevis]
MKAFAITNLAATAAVLMGFLSPMVAAKCKRDTDSPAMSDNAACATHLICGPSKCPSCQNGYCVCLDCFSGGGAPPLAI